jgi:hypothetical protein
MTIRFGLPNSGILIEPFQTHVFEIEIVEVVEKIWRPRRDSNPCYRRERALSSSRQCYSQAVCIALS